MGHCYVHFAFLFTLTYCSEIWGNTYPTNLECISLLQKRVVRIVYGAKRLAHTTPLFSNLRMLKFVDLTKLKTLIFMHIVYYNMLPRSNLCLNLKKMIRRIQRTVRTTMRAMPICVYGVKLWNSAEATLTNVHNDKSFKGSLNP